MTETPDLPEDAETEHQEAPVEEALEAPETGDIVVDAALRDLAAVPTDDLDGQLAAGEHVQQTLRSRLGDLGG